MYKGQIRHPGAARHQQAIQSNHIVWHRVEHVCQHLQFKHKYQFLCRVREMHLKISKLLTGKVRLLKTTLLAEGVPRLFCHTWILLTGSATLRSLLIFIGACCLLVPSLHTSSRTRIPVPYYLETMPKIMAWRNSLRQGAFVRLHCTLSWELWDTALPCPMPCPPFPRKNSPSSDT